MHDSCGRWRGGEHHPRPTLTLQEGQIFLRQLIHGGWKTKVRNMGRYASTEGEEDLGGVGWRSPFLQIKNPSNKTYLSFHLHIIACQHGKYELNLENLI